MAVPAEIGWDMYDPRLTIKANCSEAITRGETCYVHSTGEIHKTDNGENAIFHGCAFKDYAEDEMGVLVTHGRLYVTESQTIGAEAQVNNASAGGPPSTATNLGTACAGFAIEAYLIFVHIGRGIDT